METLHNRLFYMRAIDTESSFTLNQSDSKIYYVHGPSEFRFSKLENVKNISDLAIVYSNVGWRIVAPRRIAAFDSPSCLVNGEKVLIGNFVDLKEGDRVSFEFPSSKSSFVYTGFRNETLNSASYTVVKTPPPVAADSIDPNGFEKPSMNSHELKAAKIGKRSFSSTSPNDALEENIDAFKRVFETQIFELIDFLEQSEKRETSLRVQNERQREQISDVRFENEKNKVDHEITKQTLEETRQALSQATRAETESALIRNVETDLLRDEVSSLSLKLEKKEGEIDILHNLIIQLENKKETANQTLEKKTEECLNAKGSASDLKEKVDELVVENRKLEDALYREKERSLKTWHQLKETDGKLQALLKNSMT